MMLWWILCRVLWERRCRFGLLAWYFNTLDPKWSVSLLLSGNPWSQGLWERLQPSDLVGVSEHAASTNTYAMPFAVLQIAPVLAPAEICWCRMWDWLQWAHWSVVSPTNPVSKVPAYLEVCFECPQFLLNFGPLRETLLNHRLDVDHKGQR